LQICGVWINAFAVQDTAAMVSYETENMGDMNSATRKAIYESVFTRMKSISISNVSITVESESETSATISVTLHEIIVIKGDLDQDEGDYTKTFTLTKRDGKWLISQCTSGSDGAEEEA